MSLNFPQKPEVRLGRSPLDEVICQVKFPPILRITREPPIEFQEAIRERFPGLEAEQGVKVKFPEIGESGKPVVESSPKLYRFIASDQKSNVALAPDFFALSTKKYTHWSDFLGDLNYVSSAVIGSYQPSYATRIGLRFINRFTRKNTNSKTLEEILSLFREELTCLIRAEVWQEPKEMISQILLKDRKANLTIRTGLGRERNESFFLLDFDYYEEGQISLEDLNRRLDGYHSRIHDAFRWCLLDESLGKFEPLS
jgi:uncharacterized protein (TIGR04255 family)